MVSSLFADTVQHLTCVSIDTLAVLRSKVEAQKRAVRETNSRLRSLRQSPRLTVTSEPCIYRLPEGMHQVCVCVCVCVCVRVCV